MLTVSPAGISANSFGAINASFGYCAVAWLSRKYGANTEFMKITHSSMKSLRFYSWKGLGRLASFELKGIRYGNCSQSRFSAHRRQTRAEIRPRVLLERPVFTGGFAGSRRRVAPAPLARAKLLGSGAGWRLLVLRSSVRHEFYPGQFARAGTGFPRGSAG